MNNLVWFPTVVSFFAAMLACYLSVTLFNYYSSTKNSTLLSTVGTFLGSIIPIAIIVVLMIVWLALGNPNALGTPMVENMVQLMDISTITLTSSMILVFAGMEMAGYHASETENPRRDYPIAMFIAAAIICVLSILGTLAVGVVIPASEISLNAGIVQTFLSMFTHLQSPCGVADCAGYYLIGVCM